MAAERLTPIELLPLSRPEEGQKLRWEVYMGSENREATVVAQVADGKGSLLYDDAPKRENVSIYPI